MQNTQKIRVSYLITTRNRAQYLQRTLDNVREFITPEDELIVIDGGSSDDTVAILKRNSDVVSFYLSEPDKSEAHAFNKGWRRARGRYLKALTDDDYFYPDAMRKMVETMEAHPEIDALQCGGEFWKIENGKEVFQCYRFLPASASASVENIYRHAHIGLGLMMRTSVLELIGGAAGNYKSVDGDLSVKLAECGCNVRYLDINSYRWYVHTHSGFQDSSRFEQEWLKLDIRLGEWGRLFGGDPHKMAEFTQLARSESGPKFHQALNVIYQDSLRGRGWKVALILKLQRIHDFFKRLTRRKEDGSETRESPNGGEHAWTAALR